MRPIRHEPDDAGGAWKGFPRYPGAAPFWGERQDMAEGEDWVQFFMVADAPQDVITWYGQRLNETAVRNDDIGWGVSSWESTHHPARRSIVVAPVEAWLALFQPRAPSPAPGTRTVIAVRHGLERGAN